MSTVPLDALAGNPIPMGTRPKKPVTLAQKIRAKYPGEYDDLSDVELDKRVRAKYPGEYDDIPDSGKTVGAAFVDRGVDTAKGVGSAVLEGIKAASGGPMGQIQQGIDTSKAMYSGAVDEGAAAIARQMPEGAENTDTTMSQRMRAGVASIPVVGPAVMNTVSDLEDGKWQQVLGERGFDALATLFGYGASKAIKPITRGLKGVAETGKNALRTYVADDASLMVQAEKAAKGKIADMLGPDPKQVAKAAESEAAAASRQAARETAEKERYRGVSKKEFDTLKAQDEARRIDAKIDKGKQAAADHAARKAPKPPESAPEATTDIEKALKASITDGPVTAPPAFPGQQGAKGATKARFEMVKERIEGAKMTDIERASSNVKKWAQSGTKPEVIQRRLNDIFKGKQSFDADQVAELIKLAKED